MISRNDIRIQNAVVIGLQESNYRFYVERKITKEDFLNALRYGYIALKWQVRNAGLAELLKGEFKRFGDDVPDWWKWHFGWNEEYDIADYDTGHPLELAEKVLLADKHGIPFKHVRHLYDIAYSWAVQDDEELQNDREYVKKLVQFVQILSWTDYDLSEFDILKDFVRELIEKMFPNDVEFKWVVYGDRSMLENISYIYDKPWLWLLWKENVGE